MLTNITVDPPEASVHSSSIEAQVISGHIDELATLDVIVTPHDVEAQVTPIPINVPAIPIEVQATFEAQAALHDVIIAQPISVRTTEVQIPPFNLTDY